MLDAILKGGLLYDGRGSPPQKADIGIQNNAIQQIAPKISTPAKTICDVSNHWICPGFIDIHTHYDAEVEVQPSLPESVRHGVTSIVMGNCSLSLNIGKPAINAALFERVETMPELVSIWQKQAKEWPNSKSYIEHLKQLPLGPNIATLVGHSTLRAHVMGLERSLTEKATEKEIKVIAQLAEEALEAGCIGLSIDMVHWHRTTGAYPGFSLPSHHASYEEYAALAAVCRARDAVFQLTPNPKALFQSIWQIVKLSYGIVRAPLRCTILSAMDMAIDTRAWRAATAFASLNNSLFGANIRFQTIPEPFTIYSDGPITPLFEEFESGYLLNNLKTTHERKALWQQPHFKAKFKSDWLNLKCRTFDGDLNQIYVVDAPDGSWIGNSIAQIAANHRQDALTFFIDTLEDLDKALRWKHTGANHREKIRHQLLKHRFVLPGFSDAGAHCKNIAYFDSALSLLRQSVQTQFMPIESAIKRVTSEPASWFNLKVGVLAEGHAADIVVLNPKLLQNSIAQPELVHDSQLQATRLVKRESHSPVTAVWINGKQVVQQGAPIDGLSEEKCGIVLSNTTAKMSQKQSYHRYRNRIDDAQIDHPFISYWDIFVAKHQKKNNIICHIIAFIIMYAVVILSLLKQNPYFLLLMPLSQICGLVGHHRFESSGIDQRDTAFSWRALICLHKLFFLVTTKQYQHEIHRVNQQLGHFNKMKPADETT